MAVFRGDGGLAAANSAYLEMIASLLPDGGRLALPDLVTALAGKPSNAAEGAEFEFVSTSGRIVAFSVVPMEGGGWTLCARDLTEQRRAERSAERVQKIALIALADLAENRDTDTGEHVLRVARLTHEIARDLKAGGYDSAVLDDAFLRHAGIASILHDVGKVAIPDTILLKPGRLVADERAMMETHAAKGGAILRKAEAMLASSHQFQMATEIAEYHHERWDGSGYPHGLAGDAIPLSARIVAVADVFDALISNRPYKIAWTQERAVDHIQDAAGRDFDPLVVGALLNVLKARSGATTIEWTEQMRVGEPSVDHDHRILLALVNQISCPGTIDDPIAVEFVLDELLGYTALHFAREEDLLGRVAYPHLAEHRRIHASMIAEVRRLQRRVTAFTPSLGSDLQRFLGDWLTHHILEEDRSYVPYLWSDSA